MVDENQEASSFLSSLPRGTVSFKRRYRTMPIGSHPTWRTDEFKKWVEIHVIVQRNLKNHDHRVYELEVPDANYRRREQETEKMISWVRKNHIT